MMSRVSRLALPAFFALLMMLSGCANTQPSKFYLLESIPGAGEAEGSTALDRSICVGIGPVSIPDYLDRPQMVTRTKQNSVELAEFDRWAEPLSGSISRTVAGNVSSLLHIDNVMPSPWPASVDVTYQILIDVYRFDGVLGEKAILDAQWSILGGRGKKVLLRKRSTFVEGIQEPSFSALVTAESRALGSLSREIASALNSLTLECAQ
jgi:uncharacterized lipoprotein YmbA